MSEETPEYGAERVEVQLTFDELAAAVEISHVRLTRLIQIGVVEPVSPDAQLFAAEAAARLRRVLRLRADLGVHFTDATIILDLLDRLEALEAELDRLRGESS